MLDDLKIFIQVVDEGSMNRAAETLSTYPSTINRRLRVLEDNLSLTLFNRRVNSQTLSKDGERIYNSFKPLFTKLDHKVVTVTQFAKTLHGTLRIVVTPMISALILNELLYQFMDKYPLVNFEIFGTYYKHNGEEIKFDVGISFDFPPKNYFKVKRLIEIKGSLYASKAYVEKHGYPKTIEEVKKHKFIILARHSIGKDLNLLHLKDENGKAVNLKISKYNITVDNVIHTRQLLRTDYGIALISDLMSSELKNNEEIVQILPNYTFCDTYPVYLIRSSTTNNILVDTFIAFLNKNILDQYNGLVEYNDE